MVKAVTFIKWIIVGEEGSKDIILLNHERIHLAQWKELWYIGFIVLYYLNSIYWFLRTFSFMKAYCYNMFEVEAYNNQCDMGYVESRAKFAWKDS